MAARAVLLALLAAPLAAQNEVEPEDDSPERAYVVAPFVTSSPGFGSGAGLMSMFFYRPDATDSVSPNSSLMGLGVYSDTDSYFGGIFNQLYLAEDHWRVNVGVLGGRVRSDLTVGALDNIKFDTNVGVAFARAQRRLGSSDWFAGALASYTSFEYTSRNAAGDAYFKALDVRDESSAAVGAVGSFDTRDHPRWPTEGTLAEANLSLYPEWLGASTGYEVLQVTGNWYREPLASNVLALRANGRFTPPDTPFAGLSSLGQRGELRGYTPGENVAENLISTQAEWRWMFAERVGAVGFGGVAGLYDGGVSNLDSDSIFWSGGVGLRYMLSVENRLNFRLDFAWGEDDESGLYVSMGESF